MPKLTRLPKYLLIRESLLKSLKNGEWTAGQAIPSDKMLAEKFAVSIGTVKQAVLELVRQGYLFREQGKRTLVVDKASRFHGLRFTKMLTDFDAPEHKTSLKFCSREVILPDARLKELLHMHHRQKVIELKRIMMQEEQKLALVITYHPLKMLHGLMKLDPEEFSKYSLPILEDRLGFTKATQKLMLSSVPAEEEIMQSLNLPPGSHVLRNEVIFYTDQLLPFEYRLSYWDTREKKLCLDSHTNQAMATGYAREHTLSSSILQRVL